MKPPPGRAALAALAAAGALAACGQTGELYLPEQARDVVTRPAQGEPPPATGEAPNSPRTPDSPVAPPENEAEKDKDKPGTPPPR